MKKTVVALIALQIIVTVVMAFGLIEREAAFFVTAMLIIFTVLSSLEDGLILFILSIPWFFALPFSDSFDGMSSWRILLAMLFLRYLAERLQITDYRLQKKTEQKISIVRNSFIVMEDMFHSRLFWITAVFLGWGLLSSFAAPYPMAGFKKVLFFLNIFLLFPIVQSVIKKINFEKLLHPLRYTLYAVLAVGFLQLFSIFLFPLEQFWRFWAGHVIPIFYGYGLGELLQTSNTWFAFSDGSPPLLRMFSVFPDSHSFAMFVMLGLIVLGAQQVTHYRLPLETKKEGASSASLITLSLRHFVTPGLICAFLALIFSGSRGVWLSAAALTILLGLGYIALRKRSQHHFVRIMLQRFMLGFLFFGMLFLPASYIFSLSQRAQGVKTDSFAALKRAKSIADLDEVSNRSRLQIWKAALDTIAIYPIFGVGLGNFSVALGEDISAAKQGASAHNLYLDIASEMGLVGLFAFLALIAFILWHPLKIVRNANLLQSEFQSRHPLPPTLYAVFLVYFIWILGYSLFDVVLFNDKVLMLAVMLAALVCIRED